MAIPTPPESSVAPLPGEMTDDEPTAPEMESPPLNLTTDQAAAAGIMEPQPGDVFTLKITINGTGEGITGSIVPGSAMMDAPPAEEVPDKIKSPKDMGFDSSDGFAETDLP